VAAARLWLKGNHYAGEGLDAQERKSIEVDRERSYGEKDGSLSSTLGVLSSSIRKGGIVTTLVSSRGRIALHRGGC